MNVKIIRNKKNMGHGIARRLSIKFCSNPYVALMDADDICDLTRFEKQVEYIEKNPQVDVLGGQIIEFKNDSKEFIAKRTVKCNDSEIKNDIKKRCPFNQVTVMLKKKAVLDAGGYKDWYCDEDYYLWLRMLQKKCIFANLPDVLVYTRVGEEMYRRRGGLKYFISEAKLQKYMLRRRIINVSRFLYNVIIRFCGEVLCPSFLKGFLFSIVRDDIEKGKKLEVNVTNRKHYLKDVSIVFSVAICVYGGDNCTYVKEALNSIINQTLLPSEVIIMVDGAIPTELEKVLYDFKTEAKLL